MTGRAKTGTRRAGLTDAELLAIFLRIGVAGKLSAVELARELLQRFGSVAGIGGARDEFCAVHGMGEGKVCAVYRRRSKSRAVRWRV